MSRVRACGEADRERSEARGQRRRGSLSVSPRVWEARLPALRTHVRKGKKQAISEGGSLGNEEEVRTSSDGAPFSQARELRPRDVGLSRSQS